MSTPCVIRFTDARGTETAHVYRKLHGHPEDVVTNLSALKIVVERQDHPLSPGNIAARFVFLDVLWYALREVPLGDLDAELRTILYSPADVNEGEYRFLRQHAVLDGDSTIDEGVYLYQLDVGSESEGWLIRIGESIDVSSREVNDVFEAAHWDFEDDLAEALGRVE